MQTHQFSPSGDRRPVAVSAPNPAVALPPGAWIAVEGEAACFPLTQQVTKVGRSDPRAASQPDIALTDDAVSRRHLEIRRAGESYVLVDVGSTNGTWVNGEEIAPDQPHALQPGDRILLGCDTELVFGTGAAAPVPASAPAAGPAANLARELAAARLEIRALQEELARERRLSEVDGSPLGQRTLGQVARELEAARQQLEGRESSDDGSDPSPAPPPADAVTPGPAGHLLTQQPAALAAEVERRQAELDRLGERYASLERQHACLERHWGERLRHLDQLLAAERENTAE